MSRQLTMRPGRRLGALCATMLVVLPIAHAQTGQQAPSRWRLEVHPGDTPTFSLLATNATLGDVAADLAKQTKLRVNVEPALRETPITAQVERRPLESVLQQMASNGRVFVDYEVAGIQTPAKPVAIFFESGDGEAPPLPAGPSQTEVDIIAGHTEDGDPSRAAGTGRGRGAGRDAEPPLVVSVENNLLTVRARQQPLIQIIYDVAGRLGATVSIGTQSPAFQRLLTTPTDLQIESMDVETAVLSMSPAVRAYVRRDLLRGQTRVLRLTLVESPSGL